MDDLFQLDIFFICDFKIVFLEECDFKIDVNLYLSVKNLGPVFFKKKKSWSRVFFLYLSITILFPCYFIFISHKSWSYISFYLSITNLVPCFFFIFINNKSWLRVFFLKKKTRILVFINNKFWSFILFFFLYLLITNLNSVLFYIY